MTKAKPPAMGMISPRKRMAMGEAPAMKRGGAMKAPMVRDTDHDGMKRGGKTKGRARGGKC